MIKRSIANCIIISILLIVSVQNEKTYSTQQSSKSKIELSTNESYSSVSSSTATASSTLLATFDMSLNATANRKNADALLTSSTNKNELKVNLSQSESESSKSTRIITNRSASSSSFSASAYVNSSPFAATGLIDSAFAQNASIVLLEDRKKFTKSLNKETKRAQEKLNRLIDFKEPDDLAQEQQEQSIYYVDLDLVVNELVKFEPKTGMVELDLRLKYKWWKKDLLDDDELNSELFIQDSRELNNKLAKPQPEATSIKNKIYPNIQFNAKDVQFHVKNQVHSVDNVQVVIEPKQDTKETILARFEKFKSNNNLAAMAVNDDYVYINTNSQSEAKKKSFRRFSYLEQNVTLKFACKQSDQDESSKESEQNLGLDTSYFPFDYHICDIDFDLVPGNIRIDELNTNSNSNQSDSMPTFVFSPSQKPNRLEFENKFLDYFTLNKMVQNSNNYSWISKEWLLKKMALIYTNSTSPIVEQTQLENDMSRNLKILNSKFDHVLVSRKDLIELRDEIRFSEINSPAGTLGNRDYSKSGSRGTSGSNDGGAGGSGDKNYFTFYASESDEDTNENYNRRIKKSKANNTLIRFGKLISTPSNFTILNSERIVLENVKAPSISKVSKSNSPAHVKVKFYIYRRREPQVFIFVLPIVLFTSITFLIFFLPTSNTSEKTLIAFMNFACLLAYNIYMFKLLVYTYEFMRIPLMLQYSNCLMIIQLGVLAYTCLVKSVYHYGFLTFSSFSNSTEDAYRHILLMTGNLFNSTPQPPPPAPQQSLDVYDLFANEYNNNNNNNNNEKMNFNGNMMSHEDQDQVVYHGCEKMDNNNQMLAKTAFINGSQESVKINMPIIKLDECCDAEALNAVTTTIANNDENNYITYNNIESMAIASMSQRCACTAMETDADCCNNVDHVNHCMGNFHSGAGTPGCINDPETNKLISIRNDMLMNNNLNVQQKISNSFSQMDKLNNHNNNNKNSKIINSNWAFAKFCCGQNGHCSPEMGKFSPSPVCEHVRPYDQKHHHNQQHQQQNPVNKIFCISTATTKQLASECDYTSHLARLREPLNSKLNHKPTCSRSLSFISQALNQQQQQHHHHHQPQFKSKYNIDNLYKQNNSTHSQVELANRLIATNTTHEICKLNTNVQKLIKMEEIYIKEKIIRDEWKRKARLCDAICCLLVFFLLLVCSVFIFLILPTVRTASLMD